MKQCPGCQHQLPRTMTIWQILIRKQESMICPNCRQQLFLTAAAKKQLFFMTFLTMTALPALFVLLSLLEASAAVIAVSLIITAAALLAFMPALLTFTGKEEALF